MGKVRQWLLHCYAEFGDWHNAPSHTWWHEGGYATFGRRERGVEIAREFLREEVKEVVLGARWEMVASPPTPDSIDRVTGLVGMCSSRNSLNVTRTEERSGRYRRWLARLYLETLCLSPYMTPPTPSIVQVFFFSDFRWLTVSVDCKRGRRCGRTQRTYQRIQAHRTVTP